ncbi:hypothetical protein ScPMuIL_016350 [Solemya velum]
MASYCWTLVMDTIWYKGFWIPDPLTWDDFIAKDSSVYYGEPRHILWSFVVGICLLGIRYIYESFIVDPLARYWGVKETKKIHVESNPVLEAVYKKQKSPDSDTVQKLSKQTDFTVRQVETWFFRRRRKDAPSMLKRIRESSWQLFFYLSIFIYGVVVLYDKPWVWDTHEMWRGYPYHHVTNGVYWYYILEVGFYWSLVMTLLVDLKRKDFTEMVVHHAVTILLLLFSWVTNYTRVGTMVLALHDVADIWLQLAKLFTYFKYKRTSEVFFVIFIITWVISRLIFFPVRIIHSIFVDLNKYILPVVSLYIFKGLLLTLQVLHFIWTYFIIKAVVKKSRQGDLTDVRSDTDGESEEGEVEALVEHNTNSTTTRARNHNSNIMK